MTEAKLDQITKSFAAAFLNEPHRATGYVPTLMDQLGDRIFVDSHKLEPYYASAFAHYKLEFFWRNRQLDARFKPGRWQILMAARHLAGGAEIGALNSREIATHATTFNGLLWDDTKALSLFNRAIEVVNRGVAGNWKRDHMRNQPTTQEVVAALNQT